MSKQVYISADYDEKSGDREVADLLNIWGKDEKHYGSEQNETQQMCFGEYDRIFAVPRGGLRRI